MRKDELRAIADAADMIVNGYAFTLDGGRVRVLNLRAPFTAAVLSPDGEMLETSMDDIELSIVGDYFARNRECLEAASA